MWKIIDFSQGRSGMRKCGRYEKYRRILVRCVISAMIMTISYLEVVVVGIPDSLAAEFGNESFADYAYISNKERDLVRNVIIRFWTADTFWAKLHSNDTIRIESGYDRPRFMYRVSSSATWIEPPGNHARFEEGWGYRPPIIFPDQAHEIRQFNGIVPALGTHNPDSLTQVIFSDSTLYVRYCGEYETPDHQIVIRCFPDYIADAPQYSIPHSGALFINGKVWMSASRGRGDIMDGPFPNKDSISYHQFVSQGFAGQLTVATSDTLIITDNLIYSRARMDFSVPTSLDSCPDILGLVSENWIMVGKDVRDTLYVNAALAAIRGAISVQDIYHNWYPGWDNEKHSLFLWGTMANRNRGLFRTTDYPPGHIRGFREKDYRYDLRLKDNPPPHYLTTQGSR